jgi:mitogen-activated protein kinase kinase
VNLLYRLCQLAKVFEKEREPFVQAAKRTPVDLREWAVGLIERDNRKSHLAPQLSPATQQSLRSGDSPIVGPSSSSSPDYSLPTPTSGDIPIGGGDVRSVITSPQYNEPISNSRSPTKNGTSSLGRASGAPFHPGLPPRVSTTNSAPKLTTLNTPDHTQASGPSSANAATFTTTTLPMRPAPPAGPLPPPPVPKKENSDLEKKESRRQATFGNGLYGSGYSNAGNGSNPY